MEGEWVSAGFCSVSQLLQGKQELLGSAVPQPERQFGLHTECRIDCAPTKEVTKLVGVEQKVEGIIVT